MNNIINFCKNLTNAKLFEFVIIGVIIISAVLIGVETYYVSNQIHFIQSVILGIFTIEIIVRFIACNNIKTFFKSGWNIFDLSLVLICYIPESLFNDASTIMVLRILRVFRVLRLLRTSEEIKLIISVLIKSLKSLSYNGIFFFIFLYLFSIIAVSMFKLPDYDKLSPEKQIAYTEYIEKVSYTNKSAPEPYGTLSESMFTLFRVLTSDNWSEMRYNIIKAQEYGLINVSPITVTSFHVIWFILAAFLLLNLVVGAIVNNYQIIMEESRRKEKEKTEKSV